MFNHKPPMTPQQADLKFDTVLSRVDCIAEIKQRFVSARHAIRFLTQRAHASDNEYVAFVVGLATALEILQVELD